MTSTGFGGQAAVSVAEPTASFLASYTDPPVGSSARTTVVVFRQQTAVDGPIVSWGGPPNGYSIAHHSSRYAVNVGGVETSFSDSGWIGATPHVLIVDSSTAGSNLYMDGLLVATGATVPATAPGELFQIGWRQSEGTDGWPGFTAEVAEVAVFNTVLTSAQRSSVLNDLSGRYGLNFNGATVGSATITSKASTATSAPGTGIGSATITSRSTETTGVGIVVGTGTAVTGRATDTTKGTLVGVPTTVTGRDTAAGKGVTRGLPTSVTGAEQVAVGGSSGGTGGALTGVHLRLFGIDGATVLAVMPEITTVNAMDALNAPGALSVDLPYDAVGVDTLLATPAGYLALWDGGQEVVRACYDNTDDVQDATNDVGDDRTLSLDCAGVGQSLEWGRLYDDRADSTGKVPFNAATPGAILTSVISWAQTRGALTRIALSFTATHDSAGASWPSTASLSYDVGVSVLDVITDLSAKGFLDWRMDGMTLSVYVASTGAGNGHLGRDMSAVVLQQARDVTGSDRQQARRDINNSLLLVGDNGVSAKVDDAVSAGIYDRREGYQGESGVTAAGTLTAIGQAALPQVNRPIDARTVTYDRTGGGPQPFFDYRCGDYIYAGWERNSNGNLAPLRVRSVTAVFDGSSQQAIRSASVELNDLYLEADLRLAMKVDALVNGSSATTTKPPPATDTKTPAEPGSITNISAAYSDGTVARCSVTISWAQITQNTDGTPNTNLSGYEVQYQTNGGAWQSLGTTSDTVSFVQGLYPGWSFASRVRGDAYNGKVSAWRTSSTITLAGDTTPPQAPDAPTVAAVMAGLRVTWDGLGGGAAMPADYSRVEVHASTVTGFTPTAATLQDTIYGPPGTIPTTLVDLAYSPYYVRLVAVDVSGNKSAPSPQTGPTTPAQVSVPDISDGAVLPQALGFVIGGANLLSNSSFEDPTGALNGWTQPPTTYVTTGTGTSAGPPHGAKYATISLTDVVGMRAAGQTTGNSTIANSPLTTYPDTVVASGYVKLATAGRRLILRVTRWLGGVAQTGDPNHDQTVTATSTGSWQRLSVALPANPSSTLVSQFTVAIGIDGTDPAATNGNLIDVDAVMLQAGSAPTAYAPRPDELLPNSVGSPQLVASSVIAGKIAANAVGTNELSANSITAAKAQIAALAVVDANIASLSATKITAGVIGADLVVGARIKTADTGARVELNSGGIGAWNAAGTQTLAVASSNGNITITNGTLTSPTINAGTINSGTLNSPTINAGFFKVSAGGGHVLIGNGSSGTQAGGIWFFGDTTGAAGPATILAGDWGPNPNVQSMQITSGTQAGVYGFLSIAPDTIAFGGAKTAGTNTATPTINHPCGPGFATAIYNTGGLSQRSTDTTNWSAMFASAFNVNSTRAMKDDIRDAPIGDPLAAVRGMRPVTFTRPGALSTRMPTIKPGTDCEAVRPNRKDDPVGDRSLGFVAEEVEDVLPHVVGIGPDGEPGSLDLMGLITVLYGAVKQLDGRLAALEGRTAQ